MKQACFGRAHINDFSRIVAEEALKGDRLAIDLILDCGNELSITLKTTIDKLGIASERFRVGLSGSLFKIGDLIRLPIRGQLQQIAPRARLSNRKVVPERAAAKIALRNFASKVTSD